MRFLRATLRFLPFLPVLLLAFPGTAPARAAGWELLPLWGDSVYLAAGEDPTIVYAAGTDRLFESVDGGRSWQLVASGTYELLYTNLSSGGVLKVDPRDARRLYVTNPWLPGAGGVWRSEDGGRSWVKSDEGMAGEGVTDLAFGSGASGVIYAATSGGLYRSSDRGISWSLFAFAGQSVRHVAVAPGNPKIVLASGWDGKSYWTRRSTDAGKAFARVFKKSIERFAFDPRRPGRVIGIGLGSGGRTSIVRSDDLGAHWKVVAPLARRLEAFTFTPAGVLLAGSDLGGVSRSLDGGATWSPQLAGTEAHPVDIVSSLVMLDNAILAGGWRGVWRSGKAGRNWRLSNQGIPNQRILEVKVAADAGSSVWVATAAGLFLSRDQGETFQLHAEGLGARAIVRHLALHPIFSETAYAIADFPGLSADKMLRTDDGGGTWRVLPYPGIRYDELVLTVDPVDPDIVYAGGFDETLGITCKAWRTLDGGETWSCLSPLPRQDFLDLEIDPRDRRIVYGLFDGALYRSEDRGTSWSKAAESTSVLFKIEIDAARSDRLYARGDGLLRSGDGGRTWSTILPPPPGRYFLDPQADPERSGRIWVSLGSQILQSDDAGDTWTDLSSGLDGGYIGRLEVDPRSDVLYGADLWRGLYRLPLRGN